MRYFSKKRFTMRQVIGLLTFVFLGIAVIAYTAVTVPNSFSNGQTISSGAVNQNFSYLGDRMPAVKTAIVSDYVAVTVIVNQVPPNQNLVSLTVTPPVSGQIILTGNGEISIGQTTAANNYAVINLATTSGGWTGGTEATYALNTTGDAPNGVSVSLNIVVVFPVTGGVTTTFYMVGSRDATGRNSIVLYNPRLIALFVPSELP